MLLEEEYSLGSRLSRVHRRHSDVLEFVFISGNVSMQVKQVGICWLADIRSSLVSLLSFVSVDSLICWLADIRSSLTSLLSFVSVDSLICLLAEIRSSLASLSSFVSVDSLRCWLADIRSSLACVSSSVSMANLSRLVAASFSSLPLLSSSISMADLSQTCFSFFVRLLSDPVAVSSLSFLSNSFSSLCYNLLGIAKRVFFIPLFFSL